VNMCVVDLTGEIKDNMWNYEEPFPRFLLKPLPKVPWVETQVYCETFDGLHSQTGTYLETPAHFFGNDNCYLLADVPIYKLYRRPCHLLMLDMALFANKKARIAITREMLERAADGISIMPGDAMVIGTGWGRYWDETFYLDLSPYFTYDAMKWLIEKKPFLLGSDFPRWENLEKPEGFFKEFYEADILMLAPCIHAEEIKSRKFLLTVLPINIPGTSCAPCRAIAEIE